MAIISKWFSRVADTIAATMLAAIFITFLIQIFSRYAAKIAWLMPIPSLSDWMASLQPIGWTVNLISLLWVWAVFFGGAFVLRPRDQVTFDMLYLAVPKRTQLIFSYLSAMGVIAAMIYALPATWSAVFDNRLMQLKKIPTLQIPISGDKIEIKWLYASVILLMIVTVLRYVWKIITITRYGLPDTNLQDIIPDATNTDTKQ